MARKLARRRFLIGTAALGVNAGAGVFRPYLSRAADRPILTHGVQSGDVGADGAMVWARADRACRLRVEFATSESFREPFAATWADALPESDFTAKMGIEHLPPGQEIFYRVSPQSHAEPQIHGAPLVGRFRSIPADLRDVSFLWSGDTCGQGWGIDEGRGGMTAYATMSKHRPDFFIHSGDTIYADGPLQAEVRLKDGSLWRNLVTEEKSKPAETLAEFRGNYKYNLMDRNVRAFNAQVPILAQWDDHEVTNNWWPGQPLTGDAHKKAGYRDANMLALASRAARAFHEFMPLRVSPTEAGRVYRRISYGPLLDVFMLDMRNYRGANGQNRETIYGPSAHLLGPQQAAWLKQALKSSRATWKVLASDMPLGLWVMDDWHARQGSEAVAQGDDGPPLGREMEIADLLSFMKREKIRNTVWLTADVHYTAAHYYDPNRAQFQDFEPFWEFVSGPLHAGTFAPPPMDATFGPQTVFVKSATAETGLNLPPSAGLQFFGQVQIDGRTRAMTVTLRDLADNALWSRSFEAAI